MVDSIYKERGVGKRLTEERRAAVEGSMTDDQSELIKAVMLYRKRHKVRYVSVTEILEIAKSLGYRKV